MTRTELAFIAIGLMICIGLILWGDKADMKSYPPADFAAACKSVGGTAAHNTRHWECLK